MLNFDIKEASGVVTVEPTGPLTQEDFAKLTAAVDTYLGEHGTLTGLLIDASEFAGWKNFQGLIGHLKFIRDHHRKIRKVAFVSDTAIASHLPSLANHFVAAEIRSFQAESCDAAVTWLSSPDPPP